MRQNPSSGRGQRYAGVAAGLPSIPRSRIRSNRAKPRATMTRDREQQHAADEDGEPDPEARSMMTTTKAGSAARKNAESA